MAVSFSRFDSEPDSDPAGGYRRWLGWVGLFCLLLAFGGFVWWSQRHSPVLTPPPASSFDLGGGQSFRPLDRLTSVDIAFSLGQLGQFEELSWIETQARDSQHLAHLVVASEPVVSKPLTVNSTTRTKADIEVYQPNPGDTIQSLATKFSVGESSIRWSNDISGNKLPVDQDLLIPPPGLEGIVYRVGDGDSLESLADRFHFRPEQAVGFNDLIDEQLTVGELIFLPGAQLIEVETPVLTFGPVRTTGVEVSPIPTGTSDSCVGCQSVLAGDVIGKVGNTGWSTGPHLHLEIYDASGRRTDPWVFLRSRRDLIWPVGGRVSDNFRPAHRGLDLATTEGTPVKAIADGDIIYRGCAWVGTRWSTFAVVIDHGGYYSMSIHLQAPNNERYRDCQVNLRSNYGQKSIDYETEY